MFLDLDKVTKRVKEHLNVELCPNKRVLCVLLKSYDSVTTEIETLAQDKKAKIWVSLIMIGIALLFEKDDYFAECNICKIFGSWSWRKNRALRAKKPTVQPFHTVEKYSRITLNCIQSYMKLLRGFTRVLM